MCYQSQRMNMVPFRFRESPSQFVDAMHYLYNLEVVNLAVHINQSSGTNNSRSSPASPDTSNNSVQSLSKYISET